jgi:hypothetical protein
LSPEIYFLSQYINEHGLEAQSLVYVDWGLHNQLHALASKELQLRMHDYWPTFKELGKENQERQSAALNLSFLKVRALRSHLPRRSRPYPREDKISLLHWQATRS